MGLFSKNANRAALFGKQKFLKVCCTPEVEECCYLTNPVPLPKQTRPVIPPCQACDIDIIRNYIVNGVSVGNASLIVIDTSMLPVIIEVFFENGNLDCDATFGKITSDSPNPNISILTYDPNIIEPEENVLVATIQLNTIIGEGIYTPYLNYSLCGDNYALGIDIQIDAV